MEKQVAVVGSGISGLLACKYALSKGFRPIVFESSSTAGGVWTKTVETRKLQSPKETYHFTDFPWPSSVTEDHPNHKQVLDYVQSYARHFDLLKHIKFNTKVCVIEYEGPSEDEMQSWNLWGGTGEPFSSEGKWKVIVQDKQTLSTETYVIDFVILCIERFSDVPNIPKFTPNKGPEAFLGKVIHSMEYADMDCETAAKFMKGKQITVVGSQKFAMDIAMECSNANGIENPCTLLYRKAHWNLPDLQPWGVPLAFLYFNRFSELLLHKPGEGFLLSLLATLLSPLDISSCVIAIVPEKFYDRVQEGSIILKKSPSNFGFCKEGILVIFATGFRGEKKLKDIFISPTFQDYMMGRPDAILALSPFLYYFCPLIS